MNIHFFEEYPNEENMSKLSMIDWPATILVAAPSLEEFESIRSTHEQKHPHITFGWWPTVPGSYWVSGFANPSDLDRLFAEITSRRQEKELPILIDLELPLKKRLIVKNIFNTRNNKNKISKFFKEAAGRNLKIYTAEYPTPNRFFLRLWRMFGISPSFSQKHTKLAMCYSSMIRKSLSDKSWSNIKRFEKQFASTHQGRVSFGLGTIAIGVLGNEPILAPEDLDSDLRWAKESGVQEVFIFRLGGLNEKYMSVVKKNLHI